MESNPFFPKRFRRKVPTIIQCDSGYDFHCFYGCCCCCCGKISTQKTHHLEKTTTAAITSP